jgi:HD-GYP domain-containing protein (c-di-GMP phosphodiesterase class II)
LYQGTPTHKKIDVTYTPAPNRDAPQMPGRAVMDLIELPKARLTVGMTLNFTLRDERGATLLGKGQTILTLKQLESIRERNKIFVQIDESEEGLRALHSGLSTLNRLGAPIKDFSRHLRLDIPEVDRDKLTNRRTEDKLTGSLAERWATMESKLGGLLASAKSTEDFEGRIQGLDLHIQSLLTEDKSGSQLLLFNRAVSDFNGYSVMHSLLCAALVHTLAPVFKLSEKERCSLVCAALTMNIGMTRLQDALAAQNGNPSAVQRREISNHPAKGRQFLENAMVADSMWLEVVSLHHAPLSGPDALADWSPVQRMTRILQTVDRYTAAMSPRMSRISRTARDSALGAVVQTGVVKHDEVGSALVRILGIYPPGTYVKLVNGETAVVISRGIKPGEPLVASVINRNNQPITGPRRCDTASKDTTIESSLVASQVRINLKIAPLLRLIPR